MWGEVDHLGRIEVDYAFYPFLRASERQRKRQTPKTPGGSGGNGRRGPESPKTSVRRESGGAPGDMAGSLTI